MIYSLVWLPHVLKNAGLKVAVVDGWESRGRGDVGQIFGVICHHTVGSKNGNMPSLGTLTRGRANAIKLSDCTHYVTIEPGASKARPSVAGEPSSGAAQRGASFEEEVQGR
jgi:hypothetical protein